MKFITCASYYGTGSSAVTDFFSEFDNVHSMSDYEFRFVQDIDGISDLEFHLVENHNRHNSGHALKRFKRLVDFNSGTFFNKRYEPFFDYQYQKISYDYIKKLTDFQYRGYWFYDFYDRGKWFYYVKLLPGKLYQLLFSKGSESSEYNALPREITYCARPTESSFLLETQKYLDELFSVANQKRLDYIMVDQIVPPSNVSRYVRYFSDIKVVVVERDPRDIYLLAKYIWKSRVIPTDSIDMFCEWYRYTRAHRKIELYNEETTRMIYFEDLVFYYEETIEKLINWIGLNESQHTRKRKNFNPDVSVKNTRLWVDNKNYEYEATVISEQLSEYLYTKYI